MIDWHEEKLAGTADVAALACEARAAFPHLDINQDVEWLNATCAEPDKSLLVLSAREGGRLIGLAPFEVNASRLQFALGELTLLRKRIRRFALESHPLLADTMPSAALADCFAALAERLPENGAVFLRGVPESSAMHALLVDRASPLTSLFHVVPHGPRYLRCRIRWDGCFETYLNSLGKVSRKDLRRTLKKPESQLGVQFRLARYTSIGDIDTFLTQAAKVSEQTYQAKLLGLGLLQGTGLRARLTYTAQRGHFLGHVLFLGDEPIAFHYGYIHATRFYMVDGGYDPRWSKAQLGVLTFLQVLQDLEKHKDPVTILDYLYGDGVYKQRTSNMAEPERHYYLIKKSISGSLLAGAMRATDGLSRGLGAALDKYGVKDFVKRVVRRHAGGRLSVALLYELPLSGESTMGFAGFV